MEKICGAVHHILLKVGCEAKADVTSELVECIEENELSTARDEIFNIASEMFSERNGSVVKLELKQRKGRNLLSSIAVDIYDMYAYISGLDTSFPRDVLKQTAKLIEIENSSQTLVKSASDSVNIDAVENNVRLAQLVCQVRSLTDEVSQLQSVLRIEREERQVDMIDVNKKLDEILSQLVIGGLLKGQDMSAQSGLVPNVETQTVPVVPVVLAKHKEPAEHSSQTGLGQPPPSQNTTNNADPKPAVQHADHTPLPLNNQPRQSTGVTSEQPRVPLAERPSEQSTQANAAATTREAVGTGRAPLEANSTAEDRATYSQTLANGGPWHDVNRNRRPSKSPNIQANLKGVKFEPSKYVYVKNIYLDVNDTEADVKEKVRSFVIDNGVRIMNIQVIANKYCEDSVGCKIRIPLRQLSTVLSRNFWPDDMSCREWTDRRNERRRDQSNNSDNNDGYHHRYE